jgi:heme exporter protein A
MITTNNTTMAEVPASPAEAMISAQGLVKAFGLRPVLRGIDLQIAHGESLALLGANGSGKTTFLRIIAALSRPTAGTVTIGGWTLPREAAAIRAHLGVVGHVPMLYNDLTAEENLRFFARLYRLEAVDFGAALAKVGLSRRAADRVSTFSRGMQQRLSIARALLHNPDVLLLDEPYTGLDVDGSARLDSLIGEWRAAGRTLLLTTHDLDRSLSLSDRIAILHKGMVAGTSASDSLTAASLTTWFTTVTSDLPLSFTPDSY